MRLAIVRESQDAEERTTPHNVELRKNPSANYPDVYIRADIDRRYLVSVRGVQGRTPILVTGVVLKMTPLDSDVFRSWRENLCDCTYTADRETAHLLNKSIQILDKVCEGVEFDRAQTAPDMLAEAILRVLQPLTPSISFESASLEFRFDDQPITLTRTVSRTDLSAPGRLHQGRSSIIPLGPDKQVPSATFRSVLRDIWSRL